MKSNLNTKTMKNVFFTLMTVLFLSVSNNVNAQKIKEAGVEATFEIGRNSRDCGGFGICTKKPVKVKVTIKVENQRAFNSNLGMTEDGKLLMVVDEDNIRVIEAQMKSKKLIIEEDFILEERELGIDRYIIKVGEYKFEFDEDSKKYYTII